MTNLWLGFGILFGICVFRCDIKFYKIVLLTHFSELKIDMKI